MHAKHPTRMPGRGYIPGPSAQKVRHVWSWNVRRDMTGERRHRLYQVVGEPTVVGEAWVQRGKRDLPEQVPVYAYRVNRVKRFGPGMGFTMLRPEPRQRVSKPRPLVPGTYQQHVLTCPVCSVGAPCETAKVVWGAV